MEPTEQALAEKRKGNEAFVKNNFAEAINCYTAALELINDIKTFSNEERSILHSNRAECHIRLTKFKEAISDCDNALKYDSSNIKARFRRAKANEALSHYKAALNDLQLVIKNDPHNDKALDLLRIVQRKLGIGTGNLQDKTLDYDPETDVTQDDQNDICNYNIMNHQKVELEDQIDLKTKEQRGLEDGLEAIGMLLDDDGSKYQIANAYFALNNEECEKRLKERSKIIKNEIKDLQSQLSNVVHNMTQLRAKLKAKFGEHIGLPEIKANKPNVDNVESNY